MNATRTTLSNALGRRRRWLAAPLLGLALLASQAAEAQIAFRSAASASARAPQFRAATANVLGTSIALDAASSPTPSNSAVNNFTWSHTTSGADRILIVGVSIRNDTGQTVSGVTYAGTPLTFVRAQDKSTSVRVELWRLVAPALGANNVVVTLSGGATAKMAYGAVSLTGVDQTNPIDATNSAIGTGKTPSVTVTTVTNNAWVVDAIAFRSTANGLPTATAGGGQTEQWSGYTESGGTGPNIRGKGSTEGPKTPVGAVVMNWTLGEDVDWAAAGVALRGAGPTIDKPTGTVQNDVMIASVGVQPSTTTITPPSGWTLVRRIDNGSATTNSLAVYSKVAGASEPASYSWTLSGATFAVGGIQSFSGIDTTTPIDIDSTGQATASATTHATQSVTTTMANTMVVTSHTYASSRTWSPAPSGMTEAFDQPSGANSATGQSIVGHYALQAAAGATGTKTATAAGDADRGNAHILALRPVTPALTINKPAGTVNGDFMVAAIGIQDDAATITPPSGWTLVRRMDQASGTDNSLAIYTKAAGASEPASYTWTLSGFTHAVGGIQSFSGVDTAAGAVNVENGQTTASSTSHATPDITPTVANVMLVTAHTFASSRTWTQPAGMSKAYEIASLPTSNSEGQSIVGSYVSHVFLATGAKTATVGGDSDTGNAHILALRPLPVTGVQGGFNAYDTSTTPSTAGTGFIKTKIAGSTVSVAIVALNLPRTAVETGFTGTVKVEVMNASDNSGALDVNGCRSSWTVLQTLSNPTLVAGDNGRKTVNITQANSYPELRLRVSYPTSSPTQIGCSNDNFALRPDTFASYSATDNDWQTAGTARTLNNTTLPGGSVLHKAGRPFTVQATAVNGAGTPATTTNYAGAPTATLSDCGGSSACPSTLGTLTLGTNFVAGVMSTSTASYDDVGSFNLELRDTTYANVDAGDGTPADCSSSGRYVCSSTIAVGRFVPDNFAVALNTPSFGTVCGTFSYVGQKFNYSTAPVITVTARNFAGGTTTNYAGALWQITTASLTGKSYTWAAGTLDTSGITGADPVIASAGLGTGTLTFGSGTGLFFTRTTPVAPFDADISLAINVIDADGVAYASNPARFGQATAGNGIAFSSGKPMRFGRLVIRNANGSQLLPLPVQVEAQYWSGAPTNGFITNTLDNCTTIASANDAMGNYTGNLSGSPTCETAISGGGALSMGRRTLLLAAPGSGNTGSVNLTVNLGAAASGSTCTTQGGAPGSATTANSPYLQGNWTGVNYDQNPTARATFGVSRGAEEVIFIRENF